MPDDVKIQTEADKARDAILSRIGDISDIELFNNEVLVATYIREKTAGGIIISGNTQKEDRVQSKIGLVLKLGPTAFVSDDKWFQGITVEVGDWLIFRTGDGWEMGVGDYRNPVMCRLLVDTAVRGRVADPTKIY